MKLRTMSALILAMLLMSCTTIGLPLENIDFPQWLTIIFTIVLIAIPILAIIAMCRKDGMKEV